MFIFPTRLYDISCILFSRLRAMDFLTIKCTSYRLICRLNIFTVCNSLPTRMNSKKKFRLRCEMETALKSETFKIFITVRNEVAKVMFLLHRRSTWPGTPPGSRPPPGQVHPPGTRYTPLEQTPPGPGTAPPGPGTPPWTRYTPQPGTPPGPGTPLRTRYTPQTTYTPLGPGAPPGTRYTPRDQVHPPGPSAPSRDKATAADGTHPTGMHSCFTMQFKKIFWKQKITHILTSSFYPTSFFPRLTAFPVSESSEWKSHRPFTFECLRYRQSQYSYGESISVSVNSICLESNF